MRYFVALALALFVFTLFIWATIDVYDHRRVDLNEPSQWIFFAFALALGFSTGRVLRRILGITDSFW
jgi:hypothetical protein